MEYNSKREVGINKCEWCGHIKKVSTGLCEKCGRFLSIKRDVNGKKKNYKKVSLWKLKKMLTEKREQKLSR